VSVDGKRFGKSLLIEAFRREDDACLVGEIYTQ